MSNKQQRIILAVSNDLISDNRVHKIATSLSQQNFKVCVVGRKLSYSKALPTQIYKTTRLHLLFNKGPLFYAELNIRLFFFFLLSRYDIATANDLDTLLGVFSAAKLRCKNIVYDSHEYFTEVPEVQKRPFVKKSWHLIEKSIFPRLKNCMTVCDSIAEIYSSEYNVPVFVVRNVPFKLTQLPIGFKIEGVKKPYIIYQGAVNFGRGLELLIETMKFLPDLQLVIIGHGDEFEKLNKLVSAEKLQEQIVFTGRVHFSEIPKYTVGSILGVSFEENIGLNYYYALPNKIFDYIQCEVPILTSGLPEMKNIIDTYNCGEILKDRNPQKIAEQINQIITLKHALYKENCRKAKQDLIWENEEIKLIQLYKTI